MKRIARSPCRVLLGERRPVVATGADPALPTRRTTFARIDTTAQDFSGRERHRVVPPPREPRSPHRDWARPRRGGQAAGATTGRRAGSRGDTAHGGGGREVG